MNEQLTNNETSYPVDEDREDAIAAAKHAAEAHRRIDKVFELENSKKPSATEIINIFKKIKEHRIRLTPSEVDSNIFHATAYLEGREDTSVRVLTHGTDPMVVVQDLIKRIDTLSLCGVSVVLSPDQSS